MKSSKPDSVPEHELTQYLLGNLRGEECERLDELSITDDEFADRLSSAENDLVDAYVRDRLRGDALRDFESHYLATDVRREKVAMARTLYLAGTRLRSSVPPELSLARPNVSGAAKPGSLLRFPNQRLAWVAIAAVLVLSVTTAWLALSNYRLRQQDQAWRAASGVREEELRQLQAQVENRQTLQAGPAATLEARPAQEGGPRDTGHPARLISSLFLMPPTRGAATIPVASVGQEDRWLRLQLALESDDFSQYQVDLMDLTNNQYVWHSGPVKSAEINHRRALSLLLPVSGLQPKRYGAEVKGIAADGRHEILGSYVFAISESTSRHDERR